uniref:Kunitz trypsin inhibitor n=1 Tax=Populus tremula TaxID=113636 RepID=Q4W188_POPTN|nr:kunitz trypsin inhibitor [Populus tremula]
MKSTLLVWFSFLLFAFVLSVPSIEADTEPVLDIQGEELKAGTEYIITSIFRGAGGGDVAATNKTCPDDVIQYSLDVFQGLPVTFSPASSEDDVIRVSTDLNIKFSIKKACDRSSVWKIQKSSNSEVQWLVTTGGEEGNPGCDTFTNWFKIEKGAGTFGYNYKLVFCPEDICPSVGLCRDVGIYFESNRGRILSLSDKLSPFLVVFRKVGPLSSSI